MLLKRAILVLKWQSVTILRLSSNVVGGLPCRKRGWPGLLPCPAVGHSMDHWPLRHELSTGTTVRKGSDISLLILIVGKSGNSCIDYSCEALLGHSHSNAFLIRYITSSLLREMCFVLAMTQVPFPLLPPAAVEQLQKQEHRPPYWPQSQSSSVPNPRSAWPCPKSR